MPIKNHFETSSKHEGYTTFKIVTFENFSVFKSINRYATY